MYLNGNPRIAVDFSVNTAIFVQKIAEWTFVNLANNINLHDGYCWSYNTLEAYEKIFPWWTKRQLETVIANAVKDGLIIKGNYNHHKYDRTIWYALSSKAFSYYPELSTVENLELMANSLFSESEDKEKQIRRHESVEMHFPDRGNGFRGNVTTIPTTNTTNKKNNNPIVPLKENYDATQKSGDGSFEEFWKLYPVKKGEKPCKNIWQKDKLYKKREQILKALKNRIDHDEQWKKKFIPNPIKYLKDELWNDEIAVNGKDSAGYTQEVTGDKYVQYFDGYVVE